MTLDKDLTASDLLELTVAAMEEQDIAFGWVGRDRAEFEDIVGETLTDREWNWVHGAFDDAMLDVLETFEYELLMVARQRLSGMYAS